MTRDSFTALYIFNKVCCRTAGLLFASQGVARPGQWVKCRIVLHQIGSRWYSRCFSTVMERISSQERKEKMTRLTILATAFALVVCFGEPAFAQHGHGFGRGSAGGMMNMPGGADRGHSSREMGSPAGPHSQQNLARGNMGAAGSKTTGDLLSQNTKLSSNLQ